MKNERVPLFRLSVERLEEREVPAFLAPVTAPGDGVRVAAGDFDHDGYADVAGTGGKVIDHAVVMGGKVAVRIGNGDGTFQAPRSLLGAKGYYLESIAVLDMNDDSHLDIRVTGFARALSTHGALRTATVFSSVWLGDGDGNFGKVSTTSASVYWGWPYVWPPGAGGVGVKTDFDGNGIEDSASPDSLNGRVYVWLGNPDGTVQAPRTFAAGPNPGAMAAGDFNGDGRMDLIVVNSPGSDQPMYSVLFNDGSW